MQGFYDWIKFRRPTSVCLDVCSLCNLNCAGCPMRKNNFCGRGAGYLTFENFKKFIDKNRFIKHIEISNTGEPFLNPDIIKIMEYARLKKVALSAWGGSNFNEMSDAVLEAIAKTGVVGICIALDGARQETYSAYRRGGDFGRVIANIKKFNEYKKIHNAETKLYWQYIILPTNESPDEIRAAKALAASLSMEMYFIRDWGNWRPAIDKRPEIERETGIEFVSNSLGRPSFVPPEDALKVLACRHLWDAPQLSWDGRMFGCSANRDLEFGGNAFSDGLAACMKRGLYADTKKMLMGGRAAAGSPCAGCYFYKRRKKGPELWAEEIPKKTNQ